MKTFFPPQRCRLNTCAAALGIGLALGGCDRQAGQSAKLPAIQSRRADPFAIALAPHSGNSRLDEQIRRSQEQVRVSRSPEIALEHLGWLYVAKARESFDPGFYKLAEQCALSLEARQPSAPEALLLRGHALHSQHHFREAEVLAQQLVQTRGLSFDYGLLGDILVDTGRVDDATRAYQTMLDLKPDPQGYARAAHVRWLTGDLDGALEVIRLAAGGASGHDPESAAWLHVQLARYLWQAGKPNDAESALRMALRFQTNFAPALWLRGRMELAAQRNEEAIELLRSAVQNNPLPEYQWALADALRAADRQEEARAMEAAIISRGATSDPRSCSLFLATRREQVGLAEQLARQELAQRGDVFTQDAVAWALAAAGKFTEARTHMTLALAQGTQDARLYCHAAVIAARSGEVGQEARDSVAKAFAFKAQLLPSELAQLCAAAKQLPASALAGIVPADVFPP